MTHEFNNQASQSERREVLRNDTMLSRQQNTIDDSGGRFAKLTPATITGATPAPQYPQLPASSPWSNGFDENVEPPLGYAVDAMPQEIQSTSEPELIPQVVTSPTTEVDREGGEPVVGSTVDLPSTDDPVIGSFARRRTW